MGIPDSQIILMIADDMACNDRNMYKAHMKASHAKEAGSFIEIYDDDVEVDYRGEECSVENLLSLLTNRLDDNVPINKRLSTDRHSNILVYITGHGGDTFLKFHDKEEIQSQDLADAFSMMYTQGRYNEILFMIDTCQASTLYSYINGVKSPNIIGIGSSLKDESSYSYMNDDQLGISLVDRFTHHTLRFFEKGIKTENIKLITLFKSYKYKDLHSHAKWDHINFKRNASDVKITDFFSAVTHVDLIKYNIKLWDKNNSFLNNTCNDNYKQQLLIDINADHDRLINKDKYILLHIIIDLFKNWYNILLGLEDFNLYVAIVTVLCGLGTVELMIH